MIKQIIKKKKKIWVNFVLLDRPFTQFCSTRNAYKVTNAKFVLETRNFSNRESIISFYESLYLVFSVFANRRKFLENICSNLKSLGSFPNFFFISSNVYSGCQGSYSEMFLKQLCTLVLCFLKFGKKTFQGTFISDCFQVLPSSRFVFKEKACIVPHI